MKVFDKFKLLKLFKGYVLKDIQKFASNLRKGKVNNTPPNMKGGSQASSSPPPLLFHSYITEVVIQ
jgi:hypothetical protein